MKPCANGCTGTLQPGETTPTFTRRGSRVEVTIYHVPADTCPSCGQEFLLPETSRIVDGLLEPFHGHGQQVPSLPPAKILIDFPEAANLQKAA